MDPKYLSPEERPEHDQLMEEAGYNPTNGGPYPSHVIKENVVRLLHDAEQAGRTWATYILEEATADGAYKHWKRWEDKREKVKVYRHGLIVPVRAVRGTRVRDETGRTVHQRTFWPEMTWDQVHQQLGDADSRIAADQITRDIALKLLKLLLEAPDSATPAEACARLGVDFDDYLASDDGAA